MKAASKAKMGCIDMSERMIKTTQGPGTVKGAHARFGFDESNPIPVRFPLGGKEYLSRLRFPCGEPFLFQRVGSGGIAPDFHLVDLFDLICRKRIHRFSVYMDMYHSGMPSEAPEGLSLSTPEGIGVTVGVENFERMTFEEMKSLIERNDNS